MQGIVQRIMKCFTAYKIMELCSISANQLQTKTKCMNISPNIIFLANTNMGTHFFVSVKGWLWLQHVDHLC